MTRTTSRSTTAAATAARAGLSVAALAASGALLLTACSSSSSGTASASGSPSGSVSAAASASGNGAQEMQAYRTCLSRHGVNLPTFARRSPGAGRPSGSPGAGRGGGRGFGGGFPGYGAGTPDAATQKALDACQSLRPRFNGRGGGANSTAFKAFTSCLKDHGVVLPTPSPGASNGSGRPGSGSGFGALRGLNTADPKTAKAYETCRALLPQRPSGAASPSPAATT